jgi:CRP-like cAMP-binding protein
MDYQYILSHLSKYITLNSAEINLLTSVLKRKLVRKKEFLLIPGGICSSDFFVNKGCLKICYSNEKGVECVIEFAVENGWVVDLDSFLNNKSSIYYIQAIEDTEVVSISKADYETLHEQIPSFYKFTSQRWQQGSIDLHQRTMLSLSQTAEDRYMHFKEKYPGLENRIPQKLIAAYLGITPEFFSMLKKRWMPVFS